MRGWLEDGDDSPCARPTPAPANHSNPDTLQTTREGTSPGDSMYFNATIRFEVRKNLKDIQSDTSVKQSQRALRRQSAMMYMFAILLIVF